MDLNRRYDQSNGAKCLLRGEVSARTQLTPRVNDGEKGREETLPRIQTEFCYTHTSHSDSRVEETRIEEVRKSSEE